MAGLQSIVKDGKPSKCTDNQLPMMRKIGWKLLSEVSEEESSAVKEGIKKQTIEEAKKSEAAKEEENSKGLEASKKSKREFVKETKFGE